MHYWRDFSTTIKQFALRDDTLRSLPIYGFYDPVLTRPTVLQVRFRPGPRVDYNIGSEVIDWDYRQLTRKYRTRTPCSAHGYKRACTRKNMYARELPACI